MLKFTFEEALTLAQFTHTEAQMSDESSPEYLKRCIGAAWVYGEQHSNVPVGHLLCAETTKAIEALDVSEAAHLQRRLEAYHAYRLAFPNRSTLTAMTVAELILPESEEEADASPDENRLQEIDSAICAVLNEASTAFDVDAKMLKKEELVAKVEAEIGKISDEELVRSMNRLTLGRRLGARHSDGDLMYWLRGSEWHYRSEAINYVRRMERNSLENIISVMCGEQKFDEQDAIATVRELVQEGVMCIEVLHGVEHISLASASEEAAG